MSTPLESFDKKTPQLNSAGTDRLVPDIDLSKASFQLPSHVSNRSGRIIMDLAVEEIVDFTDKSDFEICEQMSKSYCSCVLSPQQLKSATTELGYEFEHSPEYFQEMLDVPASQLLAIFDSETKTVQGAAIYSTDGSLPDELLPYTKNISDKLELIKPLANYQVGFVRTAWIDSNARRDNLYTPLTAEMMKEMFDVHRLDYIFAYYRVSPAENRAIFAHKHVGWEPLGVEFSVELNPEKTPKKALIDPKFDNSDRERTLIEMGGLKRGILVYRREVWEEKGQAMLSTPHAYECEDDHRLYMH